MATAAERANAKSAATRALIQGKEIPPAAAAAIAESAIAQNDLDDPKTQFAIEHPEFKRFTLDLSELGFGDHEITVKTAFSYADINDLKIIADIESYASLFLYEVSRIAVGLGDAKWTQNLGQYIRPVSRTAVMREKANAILAKISVYSGAWATLDEKRNPVQHITPTLHELFVGLDADQCTDVAAYLMGRVSTLKTEHLARKNSRAAVA